MNPRLAAARALTAVLEGKASLAGSLPPMLDRVDARDRALTQDLAFGTARWQPRLSLIADALLQKPFKAGDRDIEALLLVGLYQLFHTRIPSHAAISETVGCADKLKKPQAKGLLNAVLRNALRQQESLLAGLDRDPVLHTAHPRWLQKSLKALWPEQWQAICAANNEHPPMTLRVNRRHTDRDAYLATLSVAGIEAHATPFSEDGITLETPIDVNRLPGFQQGHVSVQDEAAQLAAGLLELQPGLRVLDACAAPGGKTCHLLEREATLDVTAVDLERTRLQRVEENLKRLGLSATLIAADGRATAEWWDGKPFQRILLDAPCSATGVIRRHPDIKLTRNADDIDKLAALQGELLDALWPTLDVGGILLYATCSVMPPENTDILGAFLARTPGARELDIAGDFGVRQAHGRQLFPQPDGHDGFYYAKLVKVAASATSP
ncbi:16S rRNA (cytosine(967)-C(5))-methyltransferase RsmB [Pseudomonas matsuisoli]|uniref:16S rRNA (cytosine(967)-C(5))-methyltransferase n=1 Tax=Pseudomonas matsuisoli TaxID=1515666 RepID=A0A917PWE2_9PSED|nr:16S rRNA (cytosine(967)-C(5))-methyltransferase RsmB [Pseudomonas matsuisoli]GGJ94984.1 ribosomal RNA small subunit methyltransferase B [Pseudomonas matsuisoli]